MEGTCVLKWCLSTLKTRNSPPLFAAIFMVLPANLNLPFLAIQLSITELAIPYIMLFIVHCTQIKDMCVLPKSFNHQNLKKKYLGIVAALSLSYTHCIFLLLTSERSTC